MNVKTEKLWSRDFIIVMAACSGISFCNYFLVQTLPVYTKNLTGSNVYAGLLLPVFTLSALATRPIAGKLSDRVGRVKLLICGAVLCVITGILYNFSASFLMLLVFRSLQGFGFGIHTTSGGAVAADVIPKSRLSEGLGVFGLYGTIASALAPGIALAIIGDKPNLADFKPLFILVAVVALISLVLDSLLKYEKKKEPSKTAEHVRNVSACPAENLPKTFLGFEYGLFLPSAVIILVFIAFSSVTSFLALFALDRDLGNIGLFFTFNAIGMVLARAFLGKIADKKGPDIVVIPAIGLLMLCFMLIPFVKSAVFLFIISFPLGFAQGAICPAVNTMLFQRSSEKRRGMAAAAYFSSIDIGFGLGSLLFGFIADGLGYTFVYWGAMLFIAAAMIVYVTKLTQKKVMAYMTDGK